MTTDFTMPKLGLTMDEGTLVRWLAAEGDRVTAGQAILEVQTDKVTIEVEAPCDGVLGPHLEAEGQTVPVGGLLAEIAAPGERPAPHSRVTPLARRIAAGAGVDLASLPAHAERITAADVRAAVETPARRFSTPRARKRAREAGIDWRQLRGTGPHGRIIERDVLAGAHPSRSPGPPPEPAGGVRWEEPTPIQRIAAERTAVTFTSTPHFYLTSEVSAEALVGMRERLLPAVERRGGVRLTVTDLLVKLAAGALREHPRANASWQDGRIAVHTDINVGVAVATGDGLIVPVLHGADRRSLAELAAERSRLVEAARSGKLTPADITGGTFTLSNLGTHRIDQFHPVLNSAESVILAAGRIASRPFVVDGQLAAVRTIFLTVACDHRVLDGALAAAFFDRLIQLVEEPYEILV